MATDSTPITTVAPGDLESLAPEDFQILVDAFTASSASMPPPTPETPELWTSPVFSDLGDFGFPSPDADPLSTPVVPDGDDMLTGMFETGEMGALFPPMEEYEFTTAVEKQSTLPAPPLPDNLYTLTPESPALHDFSPSINPSSIYPSPRLPSDRSSFSSPAPSTTPALSPRKTSKPVEIVAPARRRSSATGTRKGVTPEALVPIDAPTQPRKYITPSATSRKEVPAVFARKRARSTAFGDEDDEFNEPAPGPDATEKELIEYKRRQNTVAARRSRKRKLEYQQGLEERVERLTKEVEIWKTRAIMCQDMLQANGVQFTPFQDSIED
ncbi:putative basic region leucine zipper [Lyophyllum shimeji]|uniref:Basic region leucine zipper n=1 Tax=Lyophyllum shimeji TaxID=47721 RepID=A0A9P3PLY4_LYOSH|nr:putative basic region leucine zipper [Lyophyllum shimeji]